jgi:septal ring factor EnvC (AmiA/AmiB activator)
MKQFSIILSFITALTGAAIAMTDTSLSVRGALIEVTKSLQEIEKQQMDKQVNIKTLRDIEQTIIDKITKEQHQVAETLLSLRHLTEYSPMLIMLSSESIRDIIHSLIVLQSLSPKLNEQNRITLDVMKNLTQIKSQIIEKQLDYQKVDSSYKALLNQQDKLFEQKKAVNPEVEEKPHQKSRNLKELMGEFLKTYTKQPPVPMLRLVQPVVGTIVKDQKGVRIATHQGNQVVAPFTAQVVFIGYLEDAGKAVILRYNDLYLILTGIETFTCQEGDNLLIGEPIGRMSQQLADLTLDLKQGEYSIDPSPYIVTVA